MEHTDDVCDLCGEPTHGRGIELASLGRDSNVCELCAEEEIENSELERSELEPDPDRYREGVSFDKFMDRILVSEAQKQPAQLDSPQRLRAARNQERPLGRIRFTGGK